MIISFKCKRTEELWLNGRSNRFNAISRPAMRKLFMLARAIELNDLHVPPGNRLELLTGKRIGQHSIRINQQYRICFHWNEGAEDVEITDYH